MIDGKEAFEGRFNFFTLRDQGGLVCRNPPSATDVTSYENKKMGRFTACVTRDDFLGLSTACQQFRASGDA